MFPFTFKSWLASIIHHTERLDDLDHSHLHILKYDLHCCSSQLKANYGTPGVSNIPPFFSTEGLRKTSGVSIILLLFSTEGQSSTSGVSYIYTFLHSAVRLNSGHAHNSGKLKGSNPLTLRRKNSDFVYCDITVRFWQFGLMTFNTLDKTFTNLLE